MSDQEFDLSQRFPNLRPIRKTPSLQTVNGIGCALYGRRDEDPETGTYVATHYFTVLFVPLCALGAYRVIQAQEGGWYFLGREPLSGGARLFNYLSLLVIVGLVGLVGGLIYTGTDSYKTGRKLAEADRLVEQGQAGQAAGLYRDVMLSANSSPVARDRLKALIEAPPASATEAAGVFRVAVEVHREGTTLVPDLFQQGLDTAGKHTDDPKGALEIIEAVAPVASRPQDHLPLRRKLLEKLVVTQPDDVDLASRLAVVYEALDERQRCEKLLVRHEKALGQREGAAILGRIYAAQGKYDRAFALLDPFVQGRLVQLRAAEQDYQRAIEAVQQRAVEALKSRKAPGFDYQAAERAGEAQRAAMVNSYIEAKLREDPAVGAALNAQRRQAAVVLASLDLGLVRLQRAQALANPAARKAELEAAEKVFLSISNVASQSGRYRLTLGQVYYWLGKHAEGRKLFDELLDAEKRSADILLGVAGILREVGASGEARKLVEEAYSKETDQAKKHQAAGARAVMSTDTDDEILWLERSNPQDRDVKASLHTARGKKALADGKDAEAAGFFKQAIAVYEQMPESPTSLNNGALAHFGMFRATHEREHFTRGVDRIDRALALQPGDSILLGNAVSVVLETALLDLLGAEIDLKLLKRSAQLSLLSHLYRDRAGRQKVIGELRKHPGVVKVRSYLDRLVVLSPRRHYPHNLQAELFTLFDDAEGLIAIRGRLAKVELDLERSRKEILDYYTGKDEPSKVEQWKKSQARQEEVLEAARKHGGVTRAVAAASVAQSRMSLAPLLGGTDPDQVVKLAEEAHQAAPSSATQATLIAALLFRAHEQLKKTEPAYAKLAKRSERSVGSSLIRYLLGGEKTALRDKVAAHTDVVRAAGLVAEQVKVQPDQASPSAWALLRVIRPTDADEIGKLVRADRVSEAKRAIDRVLSPLSANGALEENWRLRLDGKDSAADAVLLQAYRQGVPLPIPTAED
jgi:tetratricopeptide (TPR) repeat protein